jgi:hypothetical protein
MPWLTLRPVYSQFIYRIVLALLRQLDDELLLLQESSSQLRRLLWERWLQVRAGEPHPDPSTSTSDLYTLWRMIKRFPNGGDSSLTC